MTGGGFVVVKQTNKHALTCSSHRCLQQRELVLQTMVDHMTAETVCAEKQESVYFFLYNICKHVMRNYINVKIEFFVKVLQGFTYLTHSKIQNSNQ